MTVQWSTSVRNTILAGWEVGIGASAKIEFRTGVQPENTAAAAVGTLVATFALEPDWADAPTGGSVSMSGLPLASIATGNGTIGHYRITDSAGTTCHEQGSVSATGGGGDLTVNNPAVTSGQSIQITSWSKTAPGA